MFFIFILIIIFIYIHLMYSFAIYLILFTTFTSPHYLSKHISIISLFNYSSQSLLSMHSSILLHSFPLSLIIYLYSKHNIPSSYIILLTYLFYIKNYSISLIILSFTLKFFPIFKSRYLYTISLSLNRNNINRKKTSNDDLHQILIVFLHVNLHYEHLLRMVFFLT